MESDTVIIDTIHSDYYEKYKNIYNDEFYIFEKQDGSGEQRYTIFIDIIKLYNIIKNKVELKNRKSVLDRFYMSCMDLKMKRNKVDKNKILKLEPIKYDICKEKEEYSFFKNLNSKIKDHIFKYQLSNVEWMLEKESIKHSVSIDNMRYYHIYNDLYYDMFESIFVFRSSLEYLDFTLKGGILIDEMGLGKTLTILSLIDSTKKNDSKPNIVFTDNQLCAQWKNEILRFTDLKCIVISSKRDFEKITLKDINSVNVVIVSYDFLKNKIYSSRINQYEDKRSEDKSYIKKMCRMKEEISLKDDQSSIPFNLVEWDRVILDEYHSAYLFYNYIFCLPCNFRWLLSGTPDTQYMKNSISLLLDKFDNIDAGVQILNKYDPCMFVRKNTIESVKNEMRIPKIIKEIEYIEFSETEKSLYNSLKISNSCNSWYYEEDLRRLCCFPNLSRQLNSIIKSFSDINEIRTAIIKHNEEEIKKIENEIESQKKHYSSTREMLDVYIDERTSARMNRNLDIIQQNIITLEKNLENCKKRRNFLNNSDIQVKFKCPFCFDEKENPVVTICGHSYCYECCIEMIRSIGSCGICRQHLDKNDIVKMVPPCEGDKNVYKYGTKISNIIKYIKERPDEKIIIFSEWDEMLMKLKVILEEQEIQNFSCRGSVYQKNKSINEFINNKKGCVILLSSCNSANGINLICSNNIIFLEPSRNSKELEKQATARTNRIGQTKDTIVKYFIMKDTIEEDILKNND